jgi:DNA-binding GntR family transcriptional regulator
LRRALPRLTVVDLAEAELALNAADDSIAVANWAFHRALYRASEWTRGVAIAEVLHVMVAPYVVLYVAGLDRRNDSDAEHSAMLDACRRRDQTTAVQLLERHLNSTAEALIAVLG